jgi:hypothetical protein
MTSSNFFPTANKPKDTAEWCYGLMALFLSVRSLEIFQGMECICGFSSMLNGSGCNTHFVKKNLKGENHIPLITCVPSPSIISCGHIT